MKYSIGDVATMTGISVSTLRFYDKEGFFKDLKRSEGGIRVFSDKELEVLNVIECLKKSGMSIKDIKEFLILCEEGDSTIEKRRQLFYNRKEEVQSQIASLEQTLAFLHYKCWFYDTAKALGSAAAVMNLSADKIPAEFLEFTKRWKKEEKAA